MSCADTCVVMDYDCCNDFYREEERRAGRAHRCCECRAEIAKGDQHHYATGKTEDSFWAYRTCLVCHEIRTTFVCHTWVFGELWESINDQLFGAWDAMKAIDCLARLKTQPAIDKMRAMYNAYRDDSAA